MVRDLLLVVLCKLILVVLGLVVMVRAAQTLSFFGLGFLVLVLVRVVEVVQPVDLTLPVLEDRLRLRGF